MKCENNWTIKFLDANEGEPFEVRPVSMNLSLSRNEYDFARGKLPWKVGEMMKPHTRYKDGDLYGLSRVEICHKGQSVRRLLFRPDWIEYASDFTHFEFHDLHKSLADGLIDIQRDTVSLERIYTEVISAAQNRLIDHIKFTVPDTKTRVISGQVDGFQSGKPGTLRGKGEEQTKRVIESDYAVDFDSISPEKAVQRLNKKFRLKSWVNDSGTIVIGIPETNQIQHVAARHDDRVWRFRDPNISHGREPVKTAIVQGAWEDEPGPDTDVLSWFDEGGMADVRAVGIATRQDVDDGTSFAVKNTKAKKDALPHISRQALKERMKNQHTGSVEIDPTLSGRDVSAPIDLRPGDILRLVPDDKYFEKTTATTGQIGDRPDIVEQNCGSPVDNEGYIVRNVEHIISDSGNWKIAVDLNLYPDSEIKSYVTYFDPRSGEWVDNDQINADGELAVGMAEEI